MTSNTNVQSQQQAVQSVKKLWEEAEKRSNLQIVAILVEDSKAIKTNGKVQEVIDEYNHVIRAIYHWYRKTELVLLKTQYMSGSSLNDWVKLRDCVEMTEENYKPSGTALLYDSVVAFLHNIRQIVEQAKAERINVGTRILVIGTGKDEGSTQSTAEDVANLVRDILSHNTNEAMEYMVVFMGIEDGETDCTAVAKSMGIDERIIRPDSRPCNILPTLYMDDREVEHEISQIIKKGFMRRELPPPPLDTSVLDDED